VRELALGFDTARRSGEVPASHDQGGALSRDDDDDDDGASASGSAVDGLDLSGGRGGSGLRGKYSRTPAQVAFFRSSGHAPGCSETVTHRD
jgi:hypothetical protein